MADYLIPCLLGLEKLVGDEVKKLGLRDVRVENGRILCRGTDADAARLNLHLRCGARVLLVLGEFPAVSFEELFQGTRAIAWEDYLPRDAAFPVKGYSISSQLHSVPACQSIIKKAMVERLKSRYRMEQFPETGTKYQVRFSIFKDRAATMPGDIEEAVTQQGYNAYEYQSSDAAYDDSELLAVEGDYVATANAMIRQSPFGTILGSVQPGATYHVVGECPDCMWYKISGDVSGYVYASYLVPAGEYQQASNSNSDTGANIRSLDMLMTVDVLESSALNLREAPSTDSGVGTSVPAGTEIRVTGNVLNTDWYQCEYDGRTVYAFDDYLKPEFPQTMACNVPALNIREAADINANVIGTLTMGDKVKVSADENDWLRFEMEDGRIGYVWDEYMEAVGQ